MHTHMLTRCNRHQSHRFKICFLFWINFRYDTAGFFFVHLEQNSVRKKLRYFPKLSPNFLQNSDFRKSTISKMSFLLHIKMTHHKKTQFKIRNSAKILQNSDIFQSKLSFSEIVCMLLLQKSGQKKSLLY